MKVFVTPPINHLELSELGNENFYILGQLYKRNEEYRKYTKQATEAGRFTILDSGVGDEGEVLTNEELFELTLEIRPNEVIPLDVLYDKDETLDNFNEFVRWMKEPCNKAKLKNTSILACPQGENIGRWLECYEYLLNRPEVSCIGMSKKAIPYVMNIHSISEARQQLVSLLKSENLLKKPLHFLGQGDPREFIPYKNESIFRSTDSCYPILSAIHRQNLEESISFDRIPTPSDYFDLEITKETLPLIISNVDFLKKCCNQ